MKRTAILVLMLAPVAALAKSSQDVTWSMDQCFSSAQRFVRVDRGCKITDRDKEAALLVWECKDLRDGKEWTSRGSLEIFHATTEKGQSIVRLQTTLADEPRYMELRFLELLERKLREEHGAQPHLPSSKKPEGPSASPSPSPSASPSPSPSVPTITP